MTCHQGLATLHQKCPQPLLPVQTWAALASAHLSCLGNLTLSFSVPDTELHSTCLQPSPLANLNQNEETGEDHVWPLQAAAERVHLPPHLSGMPPAAHHGAAAAGLQGSVTVY